MSFIDSYKRLEKLCNELYFEHHGLSSYIEDMGKNPCGSYYVSGWDDDYKQLKHYRWIRNQIVHEPSCTEENMCSSDDAQWLNSFYLRIMSATDPLALYRKALDSQVEQESKQIYSAEYTRPKQKKALKPTGCLTYVVGVVLVVSAVVLIFTVI